MGDFPVLNATQLKASRKNIAPVAGRKTVPSLPAGTVLGVEGLGVTLLSIRNGVSDPLLHFVTRQHVSRRTHFPAVCMARLVGTSISCAT